MKKSKSDRKRVQAQKPRNEAFSTAMREKRNLARPGGTGYKRKPKHGGWE